MHRVMSTVVGGFSWWPVGFNIDSHGGKRRRKENCAGRGEAPSVRERNGHAGLSEELKYDRSYVLIAVLTVTRLT